MVKVKGKKKEVNLVTNKKTYYEKNKKKIKQKMLKNDAKVCEYCTKFVLKYDIHKLSALHKVSKKYAKLKAKYKELKNKK